MRRAELHAQVLDLKDRFAGRLGNLAGYCFAAQGFRYPFRHSRLQNKPPITLGSSFGGCRSRMYQCLIHAIQCDGFSKRMQAVVQTFAGKVYKRVPFEVKRNRIAACGNFGQQRRGAAAAARSS